MAAALRVGPCPSAWLAADHWCRHFASEAQIAQLATLVAASMSSPSDRTAGIALDSITARLLRRADFYELRKLQGPSSSLSVL